MDKESIEKCIWKVNTIWKFGLAAGDALTAAIAITTNQMILRWQWNVYSSNFQANGGNEMYIVQTFKQMAVHHCYN